VAVTHCSEIESAAVARPREKASNVSVTITAAREKVREILIDFLGVN
jgi:hypothetical protein